MKLTPGYALWANPTCAAGRDPLFLSDFYLVGFVLVRNNTGAIDHYHVWVAKSLDLITLVRKVGSTMRTFGICSWGEMTTAWTVRQIRCNLIEQLLRF